MALHLLTKLMVCLLATTAVFSSGGAVGEDGPPAGHQASSEHAGGHGSGALPPLPPAAAPLPHDGAVVASVETIPTLQFNPLGALKLTYEVSKAKYVVFQSNLYNRLTANRPVVETVPVLVPQTGPGASPPTWIIITIKGTTPQETVDLAVRNDNIYLIGFKNAAGAWFAFPDYKRLIKDSTPLPKQHTYGSLVGGFKNLKNLDINRAAVLGDVRFLSTYKPRSPPNAAYDTKLGTSLGRLCVVVAEAARFKSINNTVVNAMDGQGPNRITEQQANLVVVWAELSKALINWQKTKKWSVEPDNIAKEVAAAGINGPQDAVKALKTIILPMAPKLEAAEGNVEMED